MIPYVKPSCHWTLVFKTNAGERDYGPDAEALTAKERETITRSVQEFQLGESGEGQHLMREAKKYAAAAHDPEYVVALRLFIAEEMRHSRELKRFMDAHQIGAVKHTRVDSLFRWLRHFAGLELSISVLVSAEILALIYYAALAKATRSEHLRNLCQQFLRDEVTHVEFQSERIAIIRHQKRCGHLSLMVRGGVYSLSFRLMLLMIYTKHRRLFLEGGFPLRIFWRSAIGHLRKAKVMMNPRNFTWPTEIGVTPSGRNPPRTSVG